MYTTQKNLTRFQNNGHTYFLNQKDIREITSHLKKNEYTIYKPYPDSEKNILYQDQIPKVCLYEIHCSVELRHQDILGTMYSLNISDDLFGDIVLVENHYYIYILPIVQNYFEMNFQQVRNCKVEVEEISLSTLEEYHRDYEVLEFIVSSLRIDNVLASMLKECGSMIDILVNNAGVQGASYPNAHEDAYDATLDTNLKAPYFLSQTIANIWVKQSIKGNILNVCSSSSLRPAISAYTISKWGLRGLTMGLAKSLIKHEIVVNGIAPGAVATPMLHKSNDGDLTYSHSPIGRYILPEEIANMAVFLVSNMGRSIVGDIVYMTGGMGVITYDDINYDVFKNE